MTTKLSLFRLGARLFGLLSLAIALATPTIAASEVPPRADFEVIHMTPALIERLREGGLVIYMRHGATDARIPDQIPVDLDDCGSQRPLTQAGRDSLDEIGRNFAKLGLPYERPISSPFCRAKESAERVFGLPIEVDVTLRYTAAMPTAEKAPAVMRTRELVSLPVETPGSNRVVVAHGPNMAEIMDYLPPEATLIIFKPLGLEHPPGFEYLASIEPIDWPVLLNALGLE